MTEVNAPLAGKAISSGHGPHGPETLVCVFRGHGQSQQRSRSSRGSAALQSVSVDCCLQVCVCVRSRGETSGTPVLVTNPTRLPNQMGAAFSNGNAAYIHVERPYCELQGFLGLQRLGSRSACAVAQQFTPTLLCTLRFACTYRLAG
jgi:hypothetical protein